jgi:hypothetical protein
MAEMNPTDPAVRLRLMSDRMHEDFESAKFDETVTKERLAALGIQWAKNIQREADTGFKLPIVAE